MKFDPTKPVQTRDGRPARIIATDAKVEYQGKCQPIIALVQERGGNESFRSYFEDGIYLISRNHDDVDLVNAPEKRKLTGWVNVYGDCHCSPLTKEAADAHRGDNCLACLDLSKYNIEYTVGEGL